MRHPDSLDDGQTLRTERPVVLLAIDDPTLRATWAYGLSATGFDVATIDSARSSYPAGVQPDIVLMALPEDPQSIETVAHALACEFSIGAIPVVALAADMRTPALARARLAGCAAVCLATCEPDTLASGLYAVLERSERASATSTLKVSRPASRRRGHEHGTRHNTATSASWRNLWMTLTRSRSR